VNRVYRDHALREDEIAFSTDEATGLQALERIAADRPMAPGKRLARAFEYRRHGTQTVIAALNVETGEVHARCGDTRTEEDFADFIDELIETHPGYRVHHIVLDQFNTHKSEALVRLVARRCGIEEDLGVKGRSGMLASMDSLAAFLERADKAIVFHYTPKHAAWMNQVEIGFGILGKR
jgi:hypothetical protein